MRDINEIIKEYLPQCIEINGELIDAMSYSLMIGGKRVRPTLMARTYELFGRDSSDIEPFMAAIEMIHTYSLVHDDLPAMDNDVLRRGNATTWKKYGEAGGILAGDALLTYAFETATKTLDNGIDADLVVKAIKILSNKAGVYGMCGGQSVDVLLTGKDMSENELMYIFENKTAALIEASMMIGATLAGANESFVDICEKAGSLIGIAFQIRDDILDVIVDEKELGKTIGSDEANNKNTYVTLYGMDKALADVKKFSDMAKNLLNNLPGDKTFFIDLINGLENRIK